MGGFFYYFLEPSSVSIFYEYFYLISMYAEPERAAQDQQRHGQRGGREQAQGRSGAEPQEGCSTQHKPCSHLSGKITLGMGSSGHRIVTGGSFHLNPKAGGWAGRN